MLDPSSAASAHAQVDLALLWAQARREPANSSRARDLHPKVISWVASGHTQNVAAVSIAPSDVVKAFYYPQPMGADLCNVWYPNLAGSAGKSTSSEDIEGVDDGAVLFTEGFLNAFADSLDQISRLANLPEGWDSHGGSRIDDEARRDAALFLSYVHRLVPAVPAPIVGPSPAGAVVLQWIRKDPEVYVEIGSGSIDYYVAHPDQDDVLEHGVLKTSQLQQLASRLMRSLR